MAKEVSKQRKHKSMTVSVEVLIKYHRIPEAGDHLCPRRQKNIMSFSSVSGRVQKCPPGKRTDLSGRKGNSVFVT